MDDNRPGSLPCPDTDDDGIAEMLSGPNCPSNVGRLPWRTLELPDLRDGSGERLWYALSPSLRDDDSAQPINSVSVTAGLLSVAGTAPATEVAAVIIAPGSALAGQLRNPANANSPAHYLEGQNADGDNTYETASSSAGFNDLVTTISRQQLFNVVEWRVANEIRRTLLRYYTTNGYFPFANDYASGTTGTFQCKPGEMRGRLPNPNSMDISASCSGNADWNSGLSTPPPAWFFANGWHLLTYYALASACVHSTPACAGAGFLSVNGVAGKHAVVIVGSVALSTLGQPRPCAAATDCIEQQFATSDLYSRQAVSSGFNDKVAVIP